MLLATILASGMSFLAATTVNIALPSIQHAFDARINDIQWIVNSYVLALAVLILISGSLGDYFGRKRIFQYGILGFTFGSLLSSFAQSSGQLIAFQAVQGIGAAMMIPGSLAIINVCFAENVRGKAIGLWAGLSGAMAALGPLLGGWLVEDFGWSSVFLFNVPVGLLVYFTAKAYVPESYNSDARHIDWLGTLLIGTSLGALSFGLIQGPIWGWESFGIVISFIISVLALASFIFVERVSSEPLVPFDIFKNPLVRGANIATFLLYFALNGTIFFLALDLQQIQGYSPLKAGMALLPPVLLIALFSGPAGSLADRIGPRFQMIAGPVIVALGMGFLAYSGADSGYFANILPGLILFGAGMALTIAPLTKSALEVKEKYSGVASGVNNAVSRIAGLMAVAILGAVMVSFFTNTIDNKIPNLPIAKEQQEVILEQKDKLGGIEIPEGFNSFARQHTRAAINQSFSEGFKWVMLVNAILAAIAAVIGFSEIKNPTDLEYKKKRNEISHG